MMLIKSFFRRITKDLRQKKLMPLKLIFFVQTSTLYILYPYLTIHMRELGINVEETAIMSAITPFVAIIMPPVAGMIADRIGNFKILLSLFSALGGAASLLLLLVPVGRVTVQLPEDVILQVACPSGGQLFYEMHQNYPCEAMANIESNVAVESCGYSCSMNMFNESEIEASLTSKEYKLSVLDLKTLKNATYEYAIPDSDMPKIMRVPEDGRVNRKLKNLEYYKIAIRRLSTNRLFFPTQNFQLFEFDCDTKYQTTDGSRTNFTICSFDSPLPRKNANDEKPLTFKSSLRPLPLSDEDRAESIRRFVAGSVQWPGQANKSVECLPSKDITSVQIDLSNGKILNSEDCYKTCLMTAPRKDVCSNSKMQIEYNVRLTFWTYLLIRVFIGMIGGTAFAMFEGAVIAILREQKADYGLQRIYGSIGGMISSPLSGMLIDYASRGKDYADFRPAFWLYATLKMFSAFLMLTIDLEFKAPAANVVSDVLSVLKNIEVVALLLACFVLGTAWGYIESFLFWLLEDLGASRSLMGITITVGGIAGVPLLVLSGPIVSKIGHANVIFIGFIFYSIRLIGYSLIYDPWLCLIFEALESVTSSLSFTAAVTYAAKLSTTTTDSSIQGLLGGLYYGVGKGAGSLIGGFLMKYVGTRPTYQIFAVATLITGFIYFFFNLTYLSKRPQTEGNDIVKKIPKGRTKEVLENSKINKELEEHNAHKAKEFEREPYIIDDIEAINNAKNLDIIEVVETINSEEHMEDVEKRVENGERVRHRHKGVDNAAFEGEGIEDSRKYVASKK